MSDKLTNFKYSPTKVISGMQHIRKTIFKQMLTNFHIDFVVYHVKDAVSERIRLYDTIVGAQRWMVHSHHTYDVRIGKLVVHYTSDKAIAKLGQIEEWLLGEFQEHK